MGYTEGSWAPGAVSGVTDKMNNIETQYDEVIAQINACSGSDVLASRALNTNYQNASGRAMLVVVTHTCELYKGVLAYIGPSIYPVTGYPQYCVAESYFESTGTNESSITFLVPNGWYYRLHKNGSPGLTGWYEYEVW